MIILNESIVSPILLKVLEEQQIPVLEQGQWGVTLTSAKHSKRYRIFQVHGNGQKNSYKL
ncbi:hypothetical protein [Peribacillus simplex]|uniref:hypothetical protein n=1 Tax=Peribacillus simplex TaxID=1478 RepID=UPI0024C15079|nr:hypothetical protein [Peribacillus simplex]WHY97852.1 hypothetical protein QNH37_01060 [Peribacillus simplex]